MHVLVGTMQYTLYIVQYTVYRGYVQLHVYIQGTMYIVQYTLYIHVCIQYRVHTIYMYVP